jgi:glycosyltransferase involved in cell wall biosynthesis
MARLTEARQHERAVAIAAKNLRLYSDDRKFIRQACVTFGKAGALTLLLEATRAQRRIDDSPAWAEREAVVEGRWRETSPEWWPTIPGEPERLHPVSPSKVLHLLKISLPFRQSGYSVRSKYLLEAQVDAGLEPVAVTELGFPRSIGVTDFVESDEIAGIRYHRLDRGPGYDLATPSDRYLTDFAQAAVPVVREEKPAIIHAHSGHRGYEIAMVGLALGKHFGIPVVYEARGFFESLWTSDMAWSEHSETYRRRFETESRCMAAADAVVTLSESMRNEIVARGIPAEKVSVVPNGVDVDVFQPRTRSEGLVRRYGLEGAFTFGYVSNLDHPREGQETLIEAAVELRRRGINAAAMIIGEGRRRAELEQLAQRAAAGNSVIFTGSVPHDELIDYYALLDVFVIPRVSERAARLVTPLKPFEAMAAGIPLVTADLEALREITGDGRGRYFPAGDATGLADVLAELHASPQTLVAMARKARKWVVAERQWSQNGRRYAQIYHRVLGGHAESTPPRA